MKADRAASAATPIFSWQAPLRYVAVGAVATAAHYALLWILVERGHWWPALAAGAGAALGAQLGFVGNGWFTFRYRGPWLPAWWRFQLTALLGGVTSVAVVAAGVALGLHYLLAQAGATLLALVLTYLINRRWAFATAAGPLAEHQHQHQRQHQHPPTRAYQTEASTTPAAAKSRGKSGPAK